MLPFSSFSDSVQNSFTFQFVAFDGICKWFNTFATADVGRVYRTTHVER